MEPLASKIRPRTLEEFVGQEHLVGKNGPIRKMLENKIRGRNNSWAVLWRASTFLKEKLTLHPEKSLVHNIGNDNTGTHCRVSNIFDTEISSKPISVAEIPLEESSFVFQEIEKYLKSKNLSFVTLIIEKMKKLIKIL